MPISGDSTGLTTQTLSEIIQERESACQSFLGNNFQITGDTVFGNLQASDADREYDIQELLSFLVGQLSLSNSSGIFLDWNANFKNLSRISPNKTQITRTINGTVGTVVSSLTILDTNLNEEFLLVSSVTIGGTGKVQGTFESTGYGYLNVLDGDTFSIVTPTLGVSSISFVTGDDIIQEGNDAETDEVFRARAISTNNINSVAISSAIVAKILELDGVESATYIENNTNGYLYEEYTALSGTISASADSFTVTGSGTSFLTDLNVNDSIKYEDDLSNITTKVVATIVSDTELTVTDKITVAVTGASYDYAPPTLSPKSFEIIVLGGDEDEIAQIIMDNKVPTTATYGSIDVDVTDSEGVTETIYFSEPTEVRIVMEADVYYTSSLSEEEQTALKTAFVDYWNTAKSEDGGKGVALDVDSGDFGILSNTSSKIQRIRNIKVKRYTDVDWSANQYVSIGQREIATLAVADITLNLSSV